MGAHAREAARSRRRATRPSARESDLVRRRGARVGARGSHRARPEPARGARLHVPDAPRIHPRRPRRGAGADGSGGGRGEKRRALRGSRRARRGNPGSPAGGVRDPVLAGARDGAPRRGARDADPASLRRRGLLRPRLPEHADANADDVRRPDGRHSRILAWRRAGRTGEPRPPGEARDVLRRLSRRPALWAPARHREVGARRGVGRADGRAGARRGTRGDRAALGLQPHADSLHGPARSDPVEPGPASRARHRQGARVRGGAPSRAADHGAPRHRARVRLDPRTGPAVEGHRLPDGVGSGRRALRHLPLAQRTPRPGDGPVRRWARRPVAMDAVQGAARLPDGGRAGPCRGDQVETSRARDAGQPVTAIRVVR